MQAQAGHPRRARTCAAALLTCLLTLALVPVSAHAGTRTPAHRHITRSAVVLPTTVADPGHAADHSAVLPNRPASTAALLAWPATADSSPTETPSTARTPPVRGPPAKGFA